MNTLQWFPHDVHETGWDAIDRFGNTYHLVATGFGWIGKALSHEGDEIATLDWRGIDIGIKHAKDRMQMHADSVEWNATVTDRLAEVLDAQQEWAVAA